MNYSKYDILGFANDLGLNMLEVSEFYAELINEMNSALSELRSLRYQKDLVKIQKRIHNLKGVSGNYRLTDIYEQTSKINDLLKSKNYNSYELDLNNLISTSIIAEKRIKNFFFQHSIVI